MDLCNGLIRPGEFDLRDVVPSQREIVGMITTNSIDRYGEVVDPAGAMLDKYRKNPVVLLNHITWGLPIGKNIWIKAEPNGLLAKTRFADTREGADVFRLYDEGFMKAWSIGFLPLQWNDGSAGSGFRRQFTQWELLEYSAVTVPANPDAVSSALNIVQSPRIREALEGQECERNTMLAALRARIDEQQASIAELRRTIEMLDVTVQCLRRLPVHI